jgi:hypothetical protein
MAMTGASLAVRCVLRSHLLWPAPPALMGLADAASLDPHDNRRAHAQSQFGHVEQAIDAAVHKLCAFGRDDTRMTAMPRKTDRALR